MNQSLTARPLVDCKNTLGEGIQWNPILQRVFWTDIFGNALWSCDEDGRQVKKSELPGGLCAFAFGDDGKILGAFTDGLYKVDLERGTRQLICTYQPELGPRTRMNDGGLDRQGRFVVGGIDEEGMNPITPVWSVDNGNIKTILEGIGCANSIVFSPDGKTMYFADTRGKDLFAFDYDIESGTPTNKRLFASLEGREGKPDGSCVDAEGGIWNAQFGGGRVQRFLPDGRRHTHVQLDAPNVTCCCIGGRNLDRLYITTARLLMTDKEIAERPFSGGIFVCQIRHRGLPAISYWTS